MEEGLLSDGSCKLINRISNIFKMFHCLVTSMLLKSVFCNALKTNQYCSIAPVVFGFACVKFPGLYEAFCTAKFDVLSTRQFRA